MDLHPVKTAGTRTGISLLISAVIAIVALAWVTDGFQRMPSWRDISLWKHGDVVLELPDPDQKY